MAALTKNPNQVSGVSVKCRECGASDPVSPCRVCCDRMGVPYEGPCANALPGADTGAHYRYSYRARITDEDIARGFVEVKLDPYRIADIYQLGGGPREHIVKKGLRGTAKGDTERGLIRQLRDALNRWEEMLVEDGR